MTLTIKSGHLAWCALVALALARQNGDVLSPAQENLFLTRWLATALKEGANKRGNSPRLTQSFHFFMFEPIFSPVNALNQPI